MFYYLFNCLEQYNVPGARLFDYVTFRTGVAFVLAMLIAIIIGRRIIDRLQKMQVGEIIRNLGLEGQMKKPALRLWVVLSSSFPLSSRAYW